MDGKTLKTKEDYVRLDTLEDTVTEQGDEKKEKLKIEEVINKLMGGSTIKFLALYYLGAISKIAPSLMVYLPVFAGCDDGVDGTVEDKEHSLINTSSISSTHCQYREYHACDITPALARRNETLLHYTPTSYYGIANRVATQLGLEAIGYETEEDIEHVLSSNHSLYHNTLAAVIFNTVDLNMQSYSLRMKSWMSMWNTERLFPLLPLPSPRANKTDYTGPPYYFESGFLALQSAIDSRVTGFNLGKAISLQKYPHPPYKEDVYLAMIPIVLPLLLLISYGLLAADLVRELTQQTHLGLKEFMSLNGLSRSSYWASWYLVAFVLFMPTTILNLVVLYAGNALVYSDFTVVQLFLLVFTLSSISLSLLVRLMGGSTIKFLALYYLGVMSKISASLMIYLPVFAGHIPYREWVCLSPHCFSLLANHTGEETTFYTREEMCDHNLQAGVDFTWTATRSSFSVDWGLYCSKEHKVAMVKSFFFIGAFLGLLSATSMYDGIGRKKTTLIGAVIGTVATICGAFTNSFELMLAVRVAQGYGAFIVVNGLFVWTVEFAPTKMRNLVTLLCDSMLWPCGTVLLVLISYFVRDWRYIFVIVSIITFVTSIPLLFYPESPRFHLVRGNEAEAKKILMALSKLFKRPISFENVELIYSDQKQNYLAQLRDFLYFPKMLKTTLLLMFAWFVAGTLFYGLNFGWHKIGKNIFTSMLFSAVGVALGNFVAYGSNGIIGRKKAMIMFFGCSALSFLAAMPNTRLSGEWDLQRIACLLAVVFIIGAFATIYLITSELVPTSHRGMILSLCSSSARVGSFLGPYISLLYDVLDRRIVLAIFAVAAACACCDMMFVRDSTGKPIPDTPADLEKKKKSMVENGCI